MVNYQGLATLIASVTTAVVAFMTLFRQRKIKADTDEKLETMHKLTNGQSQKVADLSKALGVSEGKIIGAKEERANPLIPAAPTGELQ